MLTYKEIHLLIEQGLQGLGIFTEAANLHSEVDLALNDVVALDISRIQDIDTRDRNALEQKLIDDLTVSELKDVTKVGRYYSLDLPTSFSKIFNSYTILGSLNCGTEVGEIEPGVFYRALEATEYNNKWYKPKDIFKGENVTNITYGKVEQLNTIIKKNINVGKDSLELYSTVKFLKYGRQILFANDNLKGYIYLNVPELPLAVNITYLKLFDTSLQISFCNQRTLNLSEDLQRYYIRKTIAHLAVVNEQPQQKIVNLTTETII